MRHKILIALIIFAGLLSLPHVATAGADNQSCPHPDGQYYTTLIPVYDFRTSQVQLIEPTSQHVVQVMAESVKRVGLLWKSDWSPSCRYFGLSVRTATGTDTIMWDTVEQRQIGVFSRRTRQFDPSYIDWSPSDNYAVLDNYEGQFLWKLPSNEQFQLDNFPLWFYSPRFMWDLTRGQTLMFDGRYVVAYDVNTGKAIHKYISPYQRNVTEWAFDERTVTIWDKYLDKWAVTFDRASGVVIDAKAMGDLPADQVQFNADRRYISVGGPYLQFYDVNEATTQTADGWNPRLSIQRGYYTWHFVDATTVEFDYTRTGKHQVYDLTTRK